MRLQNHCQHLLQNGCCCPRTGHWTPGCYYFPVNINKRKQRNGSHSCWIKGMVVPAVQMLVRAPGASPDGQKQHPGCFQPRTVPAAAPAASTPCAQEPRSGAGVGSASQSALPPGCSAGKKPAENWKRRERAEKPCKNSTLTVIYISWHCINCSWMQNSS